MKRKPEHPDDWPTRRDFVSLDKLFIDTSYQRPELRHHVDTIAAEFDPVLFGAPLVSKRATGLHATIDGQQRTASARKIGLLFVPCDIVDGLTVAEEADLFVKLQRQRLSVRPVWRFYAEVTAGHPWAVDVKRIVDARGISITESSGKAATPDALSAVVALEWVWTRFGGPTLEQTLDVIVAAWPGMRERFRGELIRALALFMVNDEPEIALLIATLTHEKLGTPARLMERSGELRKGRGMGGGSTSYTVDVLRGDYGEREREARLRAKREQREQRERES